jgi:hypothetical protein
MRAVYKVFYLGIKFFVWDGLYNDKCLFIDCNECSVSDRCETGMELVG